MLDQLQGIIKQTESQGADFVDARYDELLLHTIIKDNGRIREIKTSNRTGVGFKIYFQGATGYAFTADLSNYAMKQAAIDALGIAKASAPTVMIKSEIESQSPTKNVTLTPQIKEFPWKQSTTERMEIINRMEASAQEHGKNISSLVAMYGELSGKKIFTNSEGTEIEWQPYILDIRTSVTSKTESGDLVSASDGQGGSIGLEFYKIAGNTPEDYGRNAAIWTKEKMDAKEAPAGEYRALVDEMLAGVLSHETVGHCTEADFVVSKSTVFHDKLHTTVGNELVTIYDDGEPPMNDKSAGLYLPYDDEGTKTTKTTIIENGELVGFLNSRSTSKYTQTTPSGNARAVNFSFAPIPRMKNTYFKQGDLSEEEALEALGTGIYAIQTSGGQANPGDGSFLFKSRRGYWVENGEKQYALKDVTLSGNMLDFLQNIEGVTNDFKLSAGYFGGCGKNGQFPLPCGLGGPKLLLSNARFGGQQ